MNNKTKAIVSIVLGIVITLITGMIDISGTLVGASNFGFPLAWVSMPVLATPVTNILWVNFIADVLIWSGIVFVIISLLKR